MISRKLFKRLVKQESGFVLLLALVLALLGGLIIPPLLGFVTTGVRTTGIYKEKSYELYTADAGIEDGMWQIMTKNKEIPASYELDEDLNGIKKENTAIEIEYLESGTYMITSTATSTGGNSTTIESVVTLDWTSFLENAITSAGTVVLKNDTNIIGDVYYGSGDPPDDDKVDGEIVSATIEMPDAGLVSDYYEEQAPSPTMFPLVHDMSDHEIDDPYPLGPLNFAGNLKINSPGVSGGYGIIEGIVFIKGNLDFNGRPTINMNNQIIFVTNNITAGQGCDFTGRGCLIAIGDINFPQGISTAATGEDDEDPFIFIASLNGTVILKNANDFQGSIAGNAEVELKTGCNLTNPPLEDLVPPLALDLPTYFNAVNSTAVDFITKQWKIY